MRRLPHELLLLAALLQDQLLSAGRWFPAGPHRLLRNGCGVSERASNLFSSLLRRVSLLSKMPRRWKREDASIAAQWLRGASLPPGLPEHPTRSTRTPGLSSCTTARRFGCCGSQRTSCRTALAFGYCSTVVRRVLVDWNGCNHRGSVG